MVKGSTPTFTLKLPVHTSIVKNVEVVFVQGTDFTMTVDSNRMTYDGYFVSFALKEEETLRFIPGVIADMQLSLTTWSGKIFVSEIKKISVRKKYPEDII